jgi:hypothetical protein
MAFLNKYKSLPLALIVFLQVTILILSPAERTLGNGIKPVYLHVSLTWTGMVFFLISAILGVVVFLWGNKQLSCWQRNFYLVAVLFFGVGFLISMYASWVNWGGIPWQEPRIRNALNVIVAGIGIWYLREFINLERVKGILGLVPVVYLIIGGRSPRMVLHPDSPVATSPLGIRGTFYVLFGLALLLAAWMLWIRSKQLDGCAAEE